MAREVRTRNCAQQLPTLRKSLALVGRSIANTALLKKEKKDNLKTNDENKRKSKIKKSKIVQVESLISCQVAARTERTSPMRCMRVSKHGLIIFRIKN